MNNDRYIYEAITEGVSVKVQPVFLEEQSDPSESSYIWAYFIVIENRSGETLQLLSRRWDITNALGYVEEVKGPGVVGEKPVLQNGISHQYSSFCRLSTPSGFMQGQYEMGLVDRIGVDLNMETIWVDIPMFSLDQPESGPTN